MARRKNPRVDPLSVRAVHLEEPNLDKLSDLPGLEEMQGAGLLEGMGQGFTVPSPSDDPGLRTDEDALEADLFEQMAEDRRASEEPPLDPDDDIAHR